MRLSLVVAVNPQGVIAVDGQIPWYKPADLKRFRSITMGSTLIMGRKTWDSIGRRLLPGRRTVVLSRAQTLGAVWASSFRDGVLLAKDPEWNHTDEPWVGTDVCVVGGSSVYEQALPLVSILDVTIVLDYTCPVRCDIVTFESYLQGFPGFRLVSQESNKTDGTLQHRRYERVFL